MQQSAGDPGKSFQHGQRLVDEFDGSSIILGCAGMAAIKEAAQ